MSLISFSWKKKKRSEILIMSKTNTTSIPLELLHLVFAVLGWVKSFAIFWWCEAQFGSSGYFCWGFECDKLHWYSPNATHQICFYGLKPNFGIYGFMSTWPCLIVEGLGTQAKFLEPSGYWTAINCTFIFCTANVLGWFWLHGRL